MPKRKICLFVFTLFTILFTKAQPGPPPFRIRTVTAGITLRDLNDTIPFLEAIRFLKSAEKIFVAKGYMVQTLRIATNSFPSWIGGVSYEAALPYLVKLDLIAQKNNILLSIGQVIAGDQYPSGIDKWAVELIKTTRKINFSVPISSHIQGIHKKSIQAAAAIIVAISQNSEGGEGNFRFTASANCPAGIPFFPAAFHEGPRSFAIGLESPGLLTEVFRRTDKENAKKDLTAAFEKALLPVQQIAESLATNEGLAANEKWIYDGIDDSPAPGLDASIGAAIETYTGQPFGSPSTLSACALITDVLKGLSIKKCGYSGLMLPVIEDKVLAKRAGEGRYTVQELLLFSSVSGTGLDVVPLPGNTPAAKIEDLLTDIAALSLKYTAKALSGRLFLIPGKVAGDVIDFKNPALTKSVVMKLE